MNPRSMCRKKFCRPTTVSLRFDTFSVVQKVHYENYKTNFDLQSERVC